MKILKIKHHGTRVLPLSRRFRVQHSFTIDSGLDEILEPMKVRTIENVSGVSKDYVVIRANSDVILDDNHIFFEINSDDEKFVNDKIKNSDKVGKAHNNKEFEIVMKEDIEL